MDQVENACLDRKDKNLSENTNTVCNKKIKNINSNE